MWLLFPAGLVVVGFITGLIVWAPWSPKPVAPTAVRAQSPTATTAVVSWSKPNGGATPDRFLILRAGKPAGNDPARETSRSHPRPAAPATHPAPPQSAPQG